MDGFLLILKLSAQEAGALRLRPILLTTLSTALGAAIMVPDPVFAGLTISLIAGIMSSAFFTVFVVPLLYRLLDQLEYYGHPSIGD